MQENGGEVFHKRGARCGGGRDGEMGAKLRLALEAPHPSDRLLVARREDGPTARKGAHAHELGERGAVRRGLEARHRVVRWVGRERQPQVPGQGPEGGLLVHQAVGDGPVRRVDPFAPRPFEGARESVLAEQRTQVRDTVRPAEPDIPLYPHAPRKAELSRTGKRISPLSPSLVARTGRQAAGRCRSSTTWSITSGTVPSTVTSTMRSSALPGRRCRRHAS